MKLVISGSYSTGKTTTSIALSKLTGIPKTHARTMREILPSTFPGKRLERCDFHELIELGIRRFSERIIAEQSLGKSFISDGCPLQEWVYCKTRMKFGLNPTEDKDLVASHRIIHQDKWKIFEEAVNGFEKSIKDYTKSHYDNIIHLPIEFPFTKDGHRPVSDSFRNSVETLLLDTYSELGVNVIFAKGTLENRLQYIAQSLELSVKHPITEIIQSSMNIKRMNFDNILIEKDQSNIKSVFSLI